LPYLRGRKHAWIHSGELHATNIAASRGGRPRYRISVEAAEEFAKQRQTSKPPVQQSRRRKKDPNITEFFT
jgi:hypothetical protein